MRRCCCRSGGWWLRSYSSLTRCGRGRLGFARTGGQHHREHREPRSNNDQFFHSMNCFFKNNSSQVAPKDVLKEKNSAYISILARCRLRSPRLRFASRIFLLSASGRGDLRRRSFSRFAISAARRFPSASSMASNNLSRANFRFCTCERESRTVTLIPLGLCRSVTAVATLFTF